MTYLSLSAVFLVAAALLGVAATLVSRRPPLAGAVALTAAVLFVLTAIFDTVMIAAGLFHYAPAQLIGVHVGLAPVEDFAYPLAGVVLLPALWTAVRAHRARRKQARTARTEGEA